MSDTKNGRSTELFNSLNNRQKISANLLSDKDVQEVEVAGKSLLLINIPRANRLQKPVHLSLNPLNGNAYKRLNESDCALADEEVKRMLAEQVEDSRDDRILRYYDLNDLDSESFRAYRQVFANRDPSHPWNTEDDRNFLKKIGGWRLNRETDESGLTLAGLLMFGQVHTIQEVLPYYMLDYQERPEAKAENRWTDRLTLDGKWSGNLYDFYRKVYLKLTADLKVPFRLEQGERKDETPVHIALREALANTLVHADYTDRASVLVVKRPDMFGFRNPGLMRVPVEVALQGGEPDCRNRNLHKMFRFVGVGEQAGTGIPRIFQGWSSQHWNPPKLYESSMPYNQTLLELRMIDLLPKDVLTRLQERFGKKFDVLGKDERLTLALASIEGTVNHARLTTVTSLHPAELTRLLQHLMQEGLLTSNGAGRGAVYYLPGQSMPTPEEVFGLNNLNTEDSSSYIPSSSSYKDFSSSHLEPSSSHTPARNSEGCLLSSKLELPVINDLSLLSSAFREQLELLAKEPREKRRMNKEELKEVILLVCSDYYITLQALADLLNRSPESLRNNYLTPMVRNKALSLAFPATPTHERQAYCATTSLTNNDLVK